MSAKPLTRKEWTGMELGGGAFLSTTTVDRIKATIEAGGFAPEATTETEVLRTLPGGSGGATHFTEAHLPAALRWLRYWFDIASVEPVPGKAQAWRLTVQDMRHYCLGLGSVARKAAAIAYSNERRQQGLPADVAELLKDDR